MTNDLLRSIPSISELLETPEARRVAEATSRDYVVARLREIAATLRAEIAAGAVALEPDALGREVGARLLVLESRPQSLRRVVNATGVVLHTNLGRAPLSRRALDAVVEIAGGYSNLEYDVEAGGRGKRDLHGQALLAEILGCEAAAVANNNAAAVMLVLNTFAAGGEVIVSRGELVEIGGGFRVPDVLERSGCRLREVGTTNRTRASDFEQAITENTRLLLRVHPSNYKIVGFTERPAARELADVARRHGLLLVEDLGSGCVVDLATCGLDEELTQAALADGVDVVTFSGDKLLGGPQAGIVAGRAELVERVRRNPLMRALRVDKMVYAALEATLRAYAEGRAFEEVPALAMFARTEQQLRARAEAFAARLERDGVLRVTVEPGRSVPGAGSAPGQELPTALVAVEHPDLGASELEARLRANRPPVIARVERDRLVLDLRTVLPGDEEALYVALAGLSSDR